MKRLDSTSSGPSLVRSFSLFCGKQIYISLHDILGPSVDGQHHHLIHVLSPSGYISQEHQICRSRMRWDVETM
jgi:hypothetical protein